MVYNTTDTSAAQSLYTLALVDAVLQTPGLPVTEDARAFALKRVLMRLIVQTLQRQRMNLGILSPHLSPDAQAPAMHETLTEAQAQIARDGQATELTGWSWLYYRFLRSDLAIRIEDFAEWAATHVRTLRRFRDHALTGLTELLLNEEWTLRKQQQVERLYALLPLPDAHPLVGRQAEWDKAWQVLAASDAASIFVFGGPGSGKTTFVQVLVQRLIDANRVEHLVWLTRPQTVAEVYQAVRAVVQHPASQRDLREMLLTNHVVVVIDGLETLNGDAEALVELLAYLSHTTLFLTSAEQLALPNVSLQVVLHDLELSEVQTLVRELPGLPCDEAWASRLWSTVGGNPLSLRMALSLVMQGGDLPIHGPGVLTSVFRDVFERLSLEQLALCWWLSFYPDGSATLEGLQALHANVEHSLRVLIQTALCTVHQGCFRLQPSARHFLQQQYDAHDDFAQQVDQWFTALLPVLSANPAQHHALIAGILMSDREKRYGAEQRLALMRGAWRAGLDKGFGSIWRGILKGAGANGEIDLQLAYGICLRLSGDWSEAMHHLGQVVRVSGKRGLFALQAEALLEQAIVLRLGGHYQQALSYLQRVLRYAQRVPQWDHAARAQLEYCRIAIDTQNRNLLHTCNADPSADVLLMTEVHLLLAQPYQSRQLALDALTQVRDDALPLRAALHNAVGRTYQHDADWVAAQEWFARAQTLYHRVGDRYAYARVQNNLATACMQLGQLNEAEDLLQSAITLQRAIGDQVGVGATQHNINYLRRLRLA